MIIIFVIILVTDLAEDDVLTIQPLGLGGAEEELRPVGVGSSVGHGQDTRAGVLEGEVLVLELVAVDGLAPGAVARGEVTTLAHEVGDDPVEGGALEPEALLPGAEGAEVLRGLGHHVSAQLHDDLAHRGTVGGDVEEDPNGGHCAEDGLDPSGFGGR